MKCTCYQSTSAGDGRILCKKDGCAAIHNMTFNQSEPKTVKHYVLRTHSHTDRQQLWKVMTRPCFDRMTAEGEKEHHEHMATLKDKNHRYKFFIVTMEIE